MGEAMEVEQPRPAHDLLHLGAAVLLPQQTDLVAHELRRRDEETAALLAQALDERLVLPSLSRLDRAAKRLLDLVGALTLLLVTAPVLLAFALAVKLDSRGQVLYRQERVGLGGATFGILKLRSMHTDNDDSAHAAYTAAPCPDGPAPTMTTSRICSRVIASLKPRQSAISSLLGFRRTI
jgi:hypothetical protein